MIWTVDTCTVLYRPFSEIAFKVGSEILLLRKNPVDYRYYSVQRLFMRHFAANIAVSEEKSSSIIGNAPLIVSNKHLAVDP